MQGRQPPVDYSSYGIDDIHADPGVHIAASWVSHCGCQAHVNMQNCNFNPGFQTNLACKLMLADQYCTCMQADSVIRAVCVIKLHHKADMIIRMSCRVNLSLFGTLSSCSAIMRIVDARGVLSVLTYKPEITTGCQGFFMIKAVYEVKACIFFHFTTFLASLVMHVWPSCNTLPLNCKF